MSIWQMYLLLWGWYLFRLDTGEVVQKRYKNGTKGACSTGKNPSSSPQVKSGPPFQKGVEQQQEERSFHS
jgi:hypothetical protein